ncbi:MAG: hypothetical protein U0441_37965 [Polyangiaceae bacterium]
MALDDPDMPVMGLVPSKEELEDMMTITYRHDRPEFEHSFLLPDGWYQQAPPPGKPELKDSEYDFLALGVYTLAKDFVPPVVFTVGVRPVPKKGVVCEWLEKNVILQGLALQRMTVHKFLFGWGADAIALQESDIGPLKMRVTMFEDSKRLWVLTGMAPLNLWEGSVIPLSRAICTFELAHPGAQTVPVLVSPDGTKSIP